jgi:hypothetical protein
MLWVVLVILAVGVTGCGLLQQALPRALPPTPTPAPTPTAEPAAVQLPEDMTIRNFTAWLEGRNVVGSFDAGASHVDYVYQLKQVAAEEGRLRLTGDITYAIDGQQDVVRGVSARFRAEDDQCQVLRIETDPFRIGLLGVDVPAQQSSIDVPPLSGDEATQMQLLCRVLQLVQSNPRNPLVPLLIDQINRAL